MELIKPIGQPIEYQWKDITFFVRAQATAGDKFSVSMSSPIENGKQVFTPADFYRKLIEIFVTGWRGVTEDGKDVPFSMQALERLPCDPQSDVLLLLGAFIANNTGFIESDRKNA